MLPSNRRAAAALACFGGAVVGFIAFVFLAVFVPPPIAAYRPPPHSGDFEFAASKGAYAYYIALTLGAAVGAFAVFRIRLDVVLRAALIGFAVAMLGMFALCDIFAIPALFDNRY